jgi:hypothetical protein
MKPTGGGKSVNLSALMKTNDRKHYAAAAAAKVEVIKLGQDVHAKQVTVAVQLDGATPQPAQKIAVEKYLGWVGALIRRHPGAEVVACYEAGPCGYVREARPRLSLDTRTQALFLTGYGEGFSPDVLSRMVTAWIAQAGLGVGKKGSCHLLRHTRCHPAGRAEEAGPVAIIPA